MLAPGLAFRFGEKSPGAWLAFCPLWIDSPRPGFNTTLLQARRRRRKKEAASGKAGARVLVRN